jgi:hypothetical protein
MLFVWSGKRGGGSSVFEESAGAVGCDVVG